jgi:hypothetical protein
LPNQPTKAVLLPVPNDSRESFRIRSVRLRIPNSVAVTMFTTPIVIASAKVGYTPLPITMVFNKAAGAYTLNGSVRFMVNIPTSGALCAISCVGNLDQAAAVAGIAFGPGNGASQMYAELSPWPHYTSASVLQLSTSVANLSGAGGDIDVTVYFRYWKMTV